MLAHGAPPASRITVSSSATSACGQLFEARAALECAPAITRGAGEHALESRILRELGDVAFDGSAFGEARTRYREAIEAARRSGDKGALAEALGSPRVLEGVSIEEAEQRLAQVEDLPMRAEFFFRAGLRRTLAGELFEALEQYECEIASEIDDPAREMHLRVSIASIEHALGHLGRA